MSDTGTDEIEIRLDAIAGLIPPLLTALDALAVAARHLHPPRLPALAARIGPLREPLAAGLDAFRALDWPAHLAWFREQTADAAELALQAIERFTDSVAQSEPQRMLPGAYRSLEPATRALEALYPLAAGLPPVSRFFISAARREDPELRVRLERAGHDAGTGVLHADNAVTDRGGFSLYVPEYYRAEQPLPLVVALHGGSGHGRRFLWSWLRDARSRGVLLAAPTALADTWSFSGPDQDSANLDAIVAQIAGRWAVDPQRVLLTGMSDGGTFTYLAGLCGGGSFTHLAPVAATFHPLLVDGAEPGRLRGLPVYVTHGALDWMFPVDQARMARDTLTAAGAAVVYRELEDLGHCYPAEENDRILDWLLE